MTEKLLTAMLSIITTQTNLVASMYFQEEGMAILVNATTGEFALFPGLGNLFFQLEKGSMSAMKEIGKMENCMDMEK